MASSLSSFLVCCGTKEIELDLYNKYHSFVDFYSNSPKNNIEIQSKRSIKLIKIYLNNSNNKYYSEILNFVLFDLKNEKDPVFKINIFIADDISKINDKDIPEYFFHRYRYDVFPDNCQMDNYPPCIQIELSSICNYRCVFCYQKYLNKYKDINGVMDLKTYKNIIDKIEGKVQFVSLASRGEPFLCKNINEMLKYSKGKFLSLKINTNASVLKEDNIHAILRGGVATIVFSVDAVDKERYESMRINGNFEKVIKNIEKFQNIREKYYSNSKIISRISGVKIDKFQQIEEMKSFWGSLVDQVVMVSYCPWENTYELEKNGIIDSCKELWRRMFIWHNGNINPCENDFLSFLSIGNVNDGSIKDMWGSLSYEKIRKKHIDKKRYKLEPCSRCLFG